MVLHAHVHCTCTCTCVQVPFLWYVLSIDAPCKISSIVCKLSDATSFSKGLKRTLIEPTYTCVIE